MEKIPDNKNGGESSSKDETKLLAVRFPVPHSRLYLGSTGILLEIEQKVFKDPVLSY